MNAVDVDDLYARLVERRRLLETVLLAIEEPEMFIGLSRDLREDDEAVVPPFEERLDAALAWLGLDEHGK